jgi:hypothetical protein
MFQSTSLLNLCWDFAVSASQRITEISQSSFFQDRSQTQNIPELPIEVLFHIFSFLPPKDLGRATSVCLTWKVSIEADQRFKNILALQALKGLYPSIRFYDETIWEKHADLTSLGLKVNDIEPIHKEMFIKEVNTLKNLGVEETRMMVVTIPKNSTVSKIIEFAEKPLMGNSTKIKVVNNPLANEIPVKRTFRVLFINCEPLIDEESLDAVGKESIPRNDTQQEFISRKGYETSAPLISTALTILMYVSRCPGKKNLGYDEEWFLTKPKILFDKTYKKKARGEHLLYFHYGNYGRFLSGGGNHKVLD